ncbi:hypothetical protein RvY_04311 [Ramazzottius varieornatus]|uniref:Malectin domain-containing protein n=1 Tax=Ramazzottius varieornatus TaxID=947166 RepID=A0A1D1V190_RAMVA|nr:hypothetical protein RvY_04311 [Ramazzottius varieornatus]
MRALIGTFSAKRCLQLFLSVHLIAFLSIFLLNNLISFDAVECASGSGSNKLDIVYAVNCGGEEHVDEHGVPYQPDPSVDGQASDYGLRWPSIANAHPDDQILYQTERYSDSTFGYNIPLPKSTKAVNYVLVLKFAEVYFNQAGMKVFDVLLNGDHLIVDGLDIFERSGGRAAAYDVHIPFKVTGNKLVMINTGEESDISGTSLRLDFVKTSQDNPKCNAFYIARGTLADIPKFEMKQQKPPQDEEEDEYRSEQSPMDQPLVDDWQAPDFGDFPPALPEDEIDVGLAKYYPLIAVFVFITLLTLFMFKMA